MSTMFMVPFLAAAMYCIAKFIEEHYIDKKENVALKTIVRDGLLVFIIVFVVSGVVAGFEGHFQQLMNMITETKTTHVEGSTQIFTDNPGF